VRITSLTREAMLHMQRPMPRAVDRGGNRPGGGGRGGARPLPAQAGAGAQTEPWFPTRQIGAVFMGNFRCNAPL